MSATATRATAVPSRRLLGVAAALLFLGALVPFVPAIAPLWRGALVLVSLATIVDLLTRLRAATLEVARFPPSECRIGRPSSYTTVVRNAGTQRVAITVREVPPPTLDGPVATASATLGPGESLTVEVPFTGTERGPRALLPAGIAYRAGLGLLEHRLRAAAPARIEVMPGRPSGELSVLLSRVASVEEPGTTPVRRLGGEWEFESLREYQPGDDVRTIDWRASARRHAPVVRQYEMERTTELVLAIDVGRIMGSRVDGIRKCDLAMTALLDLAAVGIQRGERVGLLAFDATPRAYLPPRTGWRHLEAMTRELASLEQRDVSPSYVDAVALLDRRHRRRGLVVVFTDFLDEISGAEMFATLTALERRHVLVFVAVGDPHVERVFDARARSEAALFERAAAGQLMLERRRTIRRLEQRGVAVIDADPRRITAPLIRRYLDLRCGTAV